MATPTNRGTRRSNATDAGQASLHDSPVQDAVAKIAQDPKLTNAMIAEKVRTTVKGSLATAKSVATQVRILRQRGVAIPPRARLPQGQRAHAA